MALSPTTAWQKAMRKSNRVINVVATITLDASTEKKFCNSIEGMKSLGAEYTPSLDYMTPIGPDIDPVARGIPKGTERTFTFTNDGEIRSLVVNNVLKGRKITAKVGEASLAIGDYLGTWGGIIQDAEPDAEEGISIVALSPLRIIELNKIRKPNGWWREHPYTIMKDIITAAGVPSSMIDSDAFDPDHADNSSVGHWNTTAALHGPDDRTIKEETDAAALLSELCRVTGTTMIEGADGKLTLKRYSHSATEVASWGPDELTDPIEQDRAWGKIINRSILFFGKRGGRAGVSEPKEKGNIYTLPDSTPWSPAQGSSANELEDDGYRHVMVREDEDSQDRYTIDGTSTDPRHFTEIFKTRWLGCRSLLKSDMTAGSPGVGSTFDIYGGHIEGFCGNRKDEGDSGEWEVSSSRKLYVQIDDEIIACDAVEQDEEITGRHEKNPHNPDPITEPEFTALLRLTVAERGAFGTTAAAHNGVEIGAANEGSTSWVVDVTIPVRYTDDEVDRWADGCPTVRVHTDIRELGPQITEIVKLTDEDYIEKGNDGATDLPFEVVGYQDDPLGDSPGVVWTLTRSRSVASSGKISKPRIEVPGSTWGDVFEEILGHDDANLDKHTTGGLDIKTAAVGSTSFTLNTGKLMGKTGPVSVREEIDFTNLPTSKDVFTYYDNELHGIINVAKTNGTDVDNTDFPGPWTRLGKIITDGTGIVSTEDLRDLLGVQGNHLRHFPGPRYSTGVSGISAYDLGRFGTGQMFMAGDETFRKWEEGYPDKIGNVSPTYYWKLNDGTGTTATDEQGNADLTIQNGHNWSNPLVKDDGTSVELNTSTSVLEATGLGETSVAALSVGFWFSAEQTGGVQTLFEFNDSGGTGQMQCYIDSGKSSDQESFAVFIEATGNPGTATSLALGFPSTLNGERHFLVVNYYEDGGSRYVTVYLNGQKHGGTQAVSGGTDLDIDEVIFGGQASASSYTATLQGTFDHIFLKTDGVVTEAQIEEAYARGSSEHAIFEHVSVPVVPGAFGSIGGVNRYKHCAVMAYDNNSGATVNNGDNFALPAAMLDPLGAINTVSKNVEIQEDGWYLFWGQVTYDAGAQADEWQVLLRTSNKEATFRGDGIFGNRRYGQGFSLTEAGNVIGHLIHLKAFDTVFMQWHGSSGSPTRAFLCGIKLFD